jgi:hypothetical protein
MKQECWVGTSMQSNCAGHLCLQKWTSISTHETLYQRQTNDGRGTSPPGPSGRAKLTLQPTRPHNLDGIMELTAPQEVSIFLRFTAELGKFGLFHSESALKRQKIRASRAAVNPMRRSKCRVRDVRQPFGRLAPYPKVILGIQSRPNHADSMSYKKFQNPASNCWPKFQNLGAPETL